MKLLIVTWVLCCIAQSHCEYLGDEVAFTALVRTLFGDKKVRLVGTNV